MGVGAGTAAAIGAAGAVGGGLISAFGASSAAGKQAAAANAAAQLQMQQYEQTRTDLQPYNLAGQSQLPALTAFPDQAKTAFDAAYGDLKSHIPGQMTQAELEQTPGYQFQLAQGLKAVQNSAAARGLGVSGAALKGAATYATGLADSNYQTQFNNAQTRFSDYGSLFNDTMAGQNALYSYLKGTATMGENAAAKSGEVGQAGAAAAGTNIAAAGQAQAAGITTATNALGKGLTGGINDYLALNKLYGGGSGAIQPVSTSNPYGYYGAGSSGPAATDMSYTATGPSY